MVILMFSIHLVLRMAVSHRFKKRVLAPQTVLTTVTVTVTKALRLLVQVALCAAKAMAVMAVPTPPGALLLEAVVVVAMIAGLPLPLGAVQML
jgi:hypothetical protein